MTVNLDEKAILVIAASIGSGHLKAGEAIVEELNSRKKDLQVEMIDFSSWKNSPIIAFLKAIYLCMLKFFPNLYELLYNLTGKKTGAFSAQTLISLVAQRDIKKIIRKYKPVAIICTHPFPAGALAMYRRLHAQKRDFFFGTLITDYSVHRMWVYQEVDLYYVAIPLMKKALLSFDIDQEKIIVSGIPIRQDFFVHFDKQAICKQFNFSFSLPTILLMGGGLGLGGIETALKTLETLKSEIQIIVVTGRNNALKRRIKKLAETSRQHIFVYGYLPSVSGFMQVADLLVSKPGAITISEAIVMELPMVLCEPIPGPEKENAFYLARQKVAIYATKDELGSIIMRILRDKNEQRSMKLAAKKLKKVHASKQIVQTIFENIGVFGL